MKILSQFYREYKGEAMLSFFTLALSLILLIIFGTREALAWFVTALPWQILYAIPTVLAVLILIALIKNIRDHLKANKVQDKQKSRSSEAAVAMLMFALLLLGLVSYSAAKDLLTPNNPQTYSGTCTVSMDLPTRIKRYRAPLFSGQKHCSLSVDEAETTALGISCTKANELAGLPIGVETEYEYIPCKENVRVTYLPETRAVLSIESY